MSADKKVASDVPPSEEDDGASTGFNRENKALLKAWRGFAQMLTLSQASDAAGTPDMKIDAP